MEFASEMILEIGAKGLVIEKTPRRSDFPSGDVEGTALDRSIGGTGTRLEECSLTGSLVGPNLESTAGIALSAELVGEERRNRIG